MIYSIICIIVRTEECDWALTAIAAGQCGPKLISINSFFGPWNIGICMGIDMDCWTAIFICQPKPGDVLVVNQDNKICSNMEMGRRWVKRRLVMNGMRWGVKIRAEYGYRRIRIVLKISRTENLHWPFDFFRTELSWKFLLGWVRRFWIFRTEIRPEPLWIVPKLEPIIW